MQSLNHVRDLFQQVTGLSWDCNEEIEQRETESVPLTKELDLYRLILSQLRSADQESRKTLSRNLTVLITRPSGLRMLLTATFDFDESSQHETTLDQRFQAMAHLVAAPPVTCCPLPQYFDRISTQVHPLMRRDASLPDSVRISICKLCAMIVNAMIARKRDLVRKTFIQPVISSLSCPAEVLIPQQCVEIICGLAMSDFDLSLLIEAFPPLLFISSMLKQSSTLFKQQLSQTLTEFLKRIDNSYHLLDDSLFNHYASCSNRYHVITLNNECNITFNATRHGKDINFEMVNNVVATTTVLVSDGFSEEQQVDFCLLLLERISSSHLILPDCAFLLYSLVEALMQMVESLLHKFPRKWVRFITETLNRLSRESDIPITPHQSSDLADQDAATGLRIDSLEVIIQIIRLLINERSRLDEADRLSIRESISLSIKSDNVVEIREALTSILVELDDTQNMSKKTEGELGVENVENFQSAMRDLNDPLMPTRAHGLVCLKRLILAGDVNIEQNWKRVLQLLEISLADGESYIYLSAINALAALSLTKPDQTLPLLLHAFQDEDRTIQERLNVAEVIVRLSKSLGESAPKYSNQIFGTFMHSLNDPEEMIRVSSLSNLAHFSSRLGLSLEPFLGELLHTVQSLIRSDESLVVRRACFMLLHLMLTGIDGQSFEVVQEYGNRLHSLAQDTYTNDADEVCRLQAQLALEEMDRIARDRIVALSQGASRKPIL